MRMLANYKNNKYIYKNKQAYNIFNPLLIVSLTIFSLQFCSSEKPKKNESNQKTLETQGELTLSLRSSKLIDKRNKEFAWRNELSLNEYNEINELDLNQETLEKLLKAQEQNFSPSYKNYLLVQKLASIDIINRRYAEASKIWEKYEKFFPSKEKEIKEVIKILNEPEGSVFVSDLGKEVNQGSSYHPVIEPSGKKLFFTGVGFPEGKGGQDIFEVILEESNWTNRKALTLINTPANESASSISVDGTELLITGNYSSSYGNGDIFASFLTDKGWTNVRHYRQPINTEHFDGDGFKTHDGRAILYISDRPEGLYEYHKKGEYFAGSFEGNTDIFISFRQESGSYGEPINLGSTINTPGAERSPFLHSDGKTLYFSTNGHGGFGDFEIYKSVRLDDTWTNWSDPVHIGKFVNTPFSDLGFQITAMADKGFISFDSPSSNQNRLLMLSPLPKRVKPEGSVNIVKGVIFDEFDSPLQSEIEWVDVDDTEQIGRLSSKPINGDYYTPLPTGKEYIIFPKKKNYIITSAILSYKNDKSFSEKSIDFKLVSIPFAISSGLEYSLNSVLFDGDKDILNAKSYIELDRLAQILNENSELKIDLFNHYSSSKPESFNLDMSNKRITKVINYLISKNINSSRIKGKGMGSAKPILPNINEDNRNKNKRTTYMLSSID